MKHADILSRNKERSRIMRGKRLLQQVIGLTVVALCLAGCGGATAKPTATPTSAPMVAGIEGRVYFADTQEAIPDVTMALNNPQIPGGPPQNPDLTVAKTTTDSQGHYSFMDIVPGKYVISLVMTTETRVSSIEVSVKDYMSSFEGASADGSTLLYIAEPEIEVSLGEILQEDFIIH